MFGWRGRLLRVNLTSGVIKKEILEPAVARDYLGGRGLGIYLHAKGNACFGRTTQRPE